jgi:transcriptional regulator with XRE-family HTH domain
MEKWSRPATTAERLKEAMKRRAIKQVDLANKTGIHKGSISNYTSGKYEPKAEVISKLAKALNCSEMWLWGYDVPMERQDSKKAISPEEPQLSEGEQLLLELFRKIPEDRQEFFLDMVRGQLGKKE